MSRNSLAALAASVSIAAAVAIASLAGTSASRAETDPLKDPGVARIREAFKVDGIALFDAHAAHAARMGVCAASIFPGLKWCVSGTAEETKGNAAYIKTTGYNIDAASRIVYAISSRRSYPLKREEFDAVVQAIGERYGAGAAVYAFKKKSEEGAEPSTGVDSLIAVWGGLRLVHLTDADYAVVESGGSLRRGHLVDHRFNLVASAKQREPIYRIEGEAGYILHLMATSPDRADVIARVVYPPVFQPAPGKPSAEANNPLVTEAVRRPGANASPERESARPSGEDAARGADAKRIEAERGLAAERLLREEAERKLEEEKAARAEAERKAAAKLREAEERAKKAEDELKAKEQGRRRQEDEKKAAEDRAKRADRERLSAEERRRAEEAERKQAEQEKRAAEERAKRAELERKAEEERRLKEEAERKAAEERAKRAEAERKVVEERRKKEEAERKAAEDRARRAEDERKALEDRRKKEEAARADHAQRERAAPDRPQADRQQADADRGEPRNGVGSDPGAAERADRDRKAEAERLARERAARPESWQRMAADAAKAAGVIWSFSETQDKLADERVLRSQTIFAVAEPNGNGSGTAANGRAAVEVIFECTIVGGDRRLRALARAFDRKSGAAVAFRTDAEGAFGVKTRFRLDDQPPQDGLVFRERQDDVASILELPMTAADLGKKVPRAAIWLRHHAVTLEFNLVAGPVSATVTPYADNLRRVLEACAQ